MCDSGIRQELLERYLQTGKIGLCRPRNKNEALFMIETVVHLYEHTKSKEPEIEEITYSLKDLSKRLNMLLN